MKTNFKDTLILFWFWYIFGRLAQCLFN